MRWPWNSSARRSTKTFDIASREPAPGGARSLIVLLDGTWNDETGKGSSGLVTNVVKLRDSLVHGDRQVVHYHRGVGNDEEYGRADRLWDGLRGGGERKIRRDAYSSLVRDFHPGDRVLIFGFSRGAASARMLARDLNDLGIPRGIRITTALRRNRQTRAIGERYESHELIGGRLNDAKVDFLGVWDTVGAFGIPVTVGPINFRRGWGDERFSNTEIAQNIERAVHAVSIDETRRAFRPTLMNRRAGVDEVWFAGVHSDVGGGYRADALGDIALRYMVDAIGDYSAATGVKIEFDDEVLARHLGSDPMSRPPTLHWHGLHTFRAVASPFKRWRDIVVLEDSRPAPQLRPRIHRSVDELRERESTARVQRTLGRPDVFEYVPYAPRSLEVLEGAYDVVG